MCEELGRRCLLCYIPACCCWLCTRSVLCGILSNGMLTIVYGGRVEGDGGSLEGLPDTTPDVRTRRRVCCCRGTCIEAGTLFVPGSRPALPPSRQYTIHPHTDFFKFEICAHRQPTLVTSRQSICTHTSIKFNSSGQHRDCAPWRTTKNA